MRDREGVTQVVFEEDVRPEVHEVAEKLRLEYCVGVRGKVVSRGTNVNPKLRSYWLDKDAVIYVSGYNLYRITGRIPRGHWDGQYRVTRQEFLDGFNTHGNEHDRCSKFVSVFRLYFDRTHTHVRKIEEIIPDVTLRCL